MYALVITSMVLVACTDGGGGVADKPAPIVQPEPIKVEPVKVVEAIPVLSDVLAAHLGDFGLSAKDLPELEELRRLNSQYKDYDVVIPQTVLDKLTEDDYALLTNVLGAADIMGELFWKQVSKDGLRWLSFYQSWDEPLGEWDSLFFRYLQINYGIYDRLHEFHAFIGDSQQPDGANYYPTGTLDNNAYQLWLADQKDEELLKKKDGEKVNEWLNGLKDEATRKQFQSVYTIWRWKTTGVLKAIPYSDYFVDDLSYAADYLRDAAVHADSPSLKKFLGSRADAFESNDYHDSDADWVRVEGSKFDITIGPYEVYEDRFLGRAGAFVAFVVINDMELSQELSQIKALLPAMEKALPWAKKYRKFKRSGGSPIFAADLLFASGDTHAGVQTSAFNLPNDEDVREKVGSKKVLLRNVMRGKHDNCLQPIAQVVLRPDQRTFVDWQSYFYHALLHELAHGIGPGKLKKKGKITSVGKELGSLYPPIEETKGDAVGNWAVSFLVKKGFFTPDRLKSRAITSLAGLFRGFGFGITEAHGRSAMIHFNFLYEAGAFNFDVESGYYWVDVDKYYPAVTELARAIMVIESKGDATAAQAFIDKYGQMPAFVKGTMNKLAEAGVPKDIRPHYRTADMIRNR